MCAGLPDLPPQRKKSRRVAVSKPLRLGGDRLWFYEGKGSYWILFDMLAASIRRGQTTVKSSSVIDGNVVGGDVARFAPAN